MSIIPAGVVVAWPGAVSAIPTGWARLSPLDGRTPRTALAATEAGGAGGSPAHTHLSSPHHHGAGFAHTHVGGVSGPGPGGIPEFLGSFPFGLSSYDGDEHTHTLPGALSGTADLDPTTATWTALAVGPPAFGVVWIVSDGTPAGIPDSALGYWTAGSVPAGLTQHVASEGRYLAGAAAGADGGATSGAATHAHAAAAHQHASSHGHAMASGQTGAASNPYVAAVGGTRLPLFYFDMPTPGHSHSTTLAASTLATDPTTAANTGTATLDPPNIGVAVVQNTSGLPRRDAGMVCLWLGLLGAIPFGWRLCDGTAGTLDLRGQFLKAVSSLGAIGGTGGALGHTHAPPATHTHTENGHHSHTLSGDIISVVSYGWEVALNAGGVGSFGPYDQTAKVHAHSGMVTGDSSVSSATTAADAQAVQALSSDLPPYLDVQALAAPGLLAVTLDAPADGAVLTQNNPTLAWHWAGTHTQQSFRVVVYADDGVSVVYDSTVVTSAVASHTIPAGHLHNTLFYRVNVEVLTTDHYLGDAAPARVSTAFTPSPTMTGLTATPHDDGVPPYVALAWTAPTISSGQSYLATNVERRLAGSADPWLVIAVLTPSATVSFNDYTAAPGTLYEYAVTVSTDYGGDTLRSAEQLAPPTAELLFLGVWLHLVADPTTALHMLSGGGGAQPHQDAVVVASWGRELPSVHVGEQLAQQWTFVGVDTLFPAFPGAPDPLWGGPDPWSRLTAFVRAAQAGGRAGVLAVRYGANREGGYGVILWDNSSRADGPTTYVPTLVVQQVAFDEATGA